MDPSMYFKGFLKVGLITFLGIIMISGLDLLRYIDIERKIQKYINKKRYGRMNIDP